MDGQGMVTYSLDGPVATITLDDGKVNALSPAMFGAIGAALDRAEADGAAVVLTGRPGVFSGGFDLGVLQAGGQPAIDLVRAGFEMSIRLLSFPAPVVVACTGHAIAMGAFLVLSGDVRIGAAGPFRTSANEVAIGLTVPFAAVELLRHRLTPSAFQRAVATAAAFPPDEALAAGFVDRIVAAGELADAAATSARALCDLDRPSHVASKLRARRPTLDAMRAGIDAELLTV
jgi:enoyl-CoA hydratase